MLTFILPENTQKFNPYCSDYPTIKPCEACKEGDFDNCRMLNDPDFNILKYIPDAPDSEEK